MDLRPIQQDIDKDKKLSKCCESCSRKRSRYLYIVKSVLYGIFHICEDCKEELVCPDYCTEEIKAVFLEKPPSTWMVEEVPLR